MSNTVNSLTNKKAQQESTNWSFMLFLKGLGDYDYEKIKNKK